MQRIFIVVFLMSIFCLTGYGQEKIEFINSSFEGDEGEMVVPVGWYSCLGEGDTNPDTHTNRSNVWRVRKREMHGKSFVGLRVSELGRVQSISTELVSPLESGTHYEFSIQLCKPESLLVNEDVAGQTDEVSNSRSSSVEFRKPVVLQIWASNEYCSFSELLVQTTPVYHTDWKTYKIRFNTEESWKILHFVAGYIVDETYNGAIFIDHCTPIIKTDSLYTSREVVSQRQESMENMLKELNSSEDRNRVRITEDLYIKEDIRKGREVERSYLYDFSILGEKTRYEITRRGVKDGEAITYDLDSGMEKRKSYYEEDMLAGWQYSYYENGENKSVMRYDKGVKVGTHTHYYDNGKVLIRVDWGDGDYVKNILELNNVEGKLIDIKEFRKNFIEHFLVNDDLTISFYLPLKGGYETIDLKGPS